MELLRGASAAIAKGAVRRDTDTWCQALWDEGQQLAGPREAQRHLLVNGTSGNVLSFVEHILFKGHVRAHGL